MLKTEKQVITEKVNLLSELVSELSRLCTEKEWNGKDYDTYITVYRVIVQRQQELIREESQH